MRILYTGSNGQLGRELARVSWPEGWTAVGLDRNALDLSDPAAITQVVESGHDGHPWGAVINGAAYTAVDKAENDQLTAWQVNALAPAAFAEACGKADIPLIQVSTDYVFGGAGQGARKVDDPVAPLSVYGASKLGGELAVRTSKARHVIVRAAWVVSAHGSNFVKTMLRLGHERGRLRVVDDQVGSPTAAGDLAEVLATITTRLIVNSDAPSAIYHFSNAGAVSWAGFAAEIFRQSAERNGPVATVEPIATTEYPTPARRPANSLLSHDEILSAYGIAPRPWQDALGDILDELIGAKK